MFWFKILQSNQIYRPQQIEVHIYLVNYGQQLWKKV
jgi:hypothetical protein